MAASLSQILADIIIDAPELVTIVTAIEAMIPQEESATTFAARQKISEPVQESLAAFADVLIAQIKAMQTAGTPTTVPAGSPTAAKPPAPTTGPGVAGGKIAP